MKQPKHLLYRQIIVIIHLERFPLQEAFFTSHFIRKLNESTQNPLALCPSSSSNKQVQFYVINEFKAFKPESTSNLGYCQNTDK